MVDTREMVTWYPPGHEHGYRAGNEGCMFAVGEWGNRTMEMTMAMAMVMAIEMAVVGWGVKKRRNCDR
jgi:hypothetical protein